MARGQDRAWSSQFLLTGLRRASVRTSLVGTVPIGSITSFQVRCATPTTGVTFFTWSPILGKATTSSNKSSRNRHARTPHRSMITEFSTSIEAPQATSPKRRLEYYTTRSYMEGWLFSQGKTPRWVFLLPSLATISRDLGSRESPLLVTPTIMNSLISWVLVDGGCSWALITLNVLDRL
jgi:hypothetical protein